MEKIFILIIVMAVAVFISLPFFRGRLEEKSEDSDLPKNDLEAELNRLNAEKESLLGAIKEIDFDYKLGKLSKEDYRDLETKYKTQAALLLKEIDHLEGKVESSGLEKEIEEEIRQLRRTKLGDGKELEKEIFNARRSRVEYSELICAKCGAQCQSEDRFCSKCGAKLREDQTSQAY